MCSKKFLKYEFLELLKFPFLYIHSIQVSYTCIKTPFYLDGLSNLQTNYRM